MGKICKTILDPKQGPEFILKNFINDIAALEDDKTLLDTCDIDHFNRDLGVNLDASRLEADVRLKRKTIPDVADDLYYAADKVPIERGMAFDRKHLLTTQTDDLWDKTASEIKTHQQETENLALERIRKKLALYEKHFVRDPVAADLMTPDEQEYIEVQVANARQVLEKKDLKNITAAILWFDSQRAGWYQLLMDRSMAGVYTWKTLDWIWNKGGRTLYPLAAGIGAGMAIGPWLIPAAIAAAAFSDSVGEQSGMAILDPKVTWGDAGTQIAYNAPFDLLEGTLFYLGPWAGSIGYVGTESLRAAGDPRNVSLPLRDKAIQGVVQGAITTGCMVLGAGVSRKMAPWIIRTFRSVEVPFTRSKIDLPSVSHESRPVVAPEPTVTSAPPVVNGSPSPAKAGTRGARLAEYKRTQPEKLGPANDGKAVTADEPEVTKRQGSSASLAAGEVRYRVVMTAEAREDLVVIHPTVRQQLERFIERLQAKLAAQPNIGLISDIEPAYQGSHRFLCWKGKIHRPSKPRVYFVVEGTNGNRQIRVLGFSIGEQGQREVLQRIERIHGI